MHRSCLLESEGFNQLAQGDGAYYLYNKNDMYIGRAIEKYGEFSMLEWQLLQQLCDKGSFVIEVGANIGAHTVRLAKQVGMEGRVIAFEPQRLVYQTLCANVALNSLQNVDCYWLAAGETECQIFVPELDPERVNSFGSLELQDADFGRKVDCICLDRFLGMPRVDLIKIDVEGMEAAVLRGGRGLIDKFQPVLYVENDRVEKSEQLIRLIGELGYRMYWHVPPLFNPDNHYGVKEDIYPRLVSFNMICLPSGSEIELVDFVEVTDPLWHPLRQ